MDLKTFQAGIKPDATEAAYHLGYLVPGIMGDVGDLFALRANAALREQDVSGEAAVEMYGELAWKTAILLDSYGIDEVEAEITEAMQHQWAGQISGWLSLANRAQLTAAMWLEDRPHLIPGSAQRLWVSCRMRAEEVTGVDFDTILQTHLDKAVL